MRRKELLGGREQRGRKECQVWCHWRVLWDAERGTVHLLAVRITALPDAVRVERKALTLHPNKGIALKMVDYSLKNTFL